MGVPPDWGVLDGKVPGKTKQGTAEVIEMQGRVLESRVVPKVWEVAAWICGYKSSGTTPYELLVY